MGKIKRFGVSIDEDLCLRFDRHIGAQGYSNRSEALRDLIRDHLVADQWKLDGMESVASLSLVYDHHTRELSETLNSIQHQYHHLVVSSLHVHIDHDNCLEVIIFKGPNTLIKSIADRLTATRGVKHGKLTMSTTGHGL
ncbi:MAG: nickel-responsive transcriptional regulator NikR [Candidatus Glassbacteria bacterium]|nr:nickel-responsive transcriptional regulator NikR [Candidatus Glassbacteria bacterium]